MLRCKEEFDSDLDIVQNAKRRRAKFFASSSPQSKQTQILAIGIRFYNVFLIL